MGPIVLISPGNPFYAERLRGLARGFHALGYSCVTCDRVIDHQLLADWTAAVDAPVCIEMNRVRSPAIRWPDTVGHAAWFADYAVNGKNVTRDLGANDRIYFLIHPSAFGIDVPQGRAWSILLPSVPANVPQASTRTFERDFCMAGFIPSPLDDRSPVSQMPNGHVVTLGEFLAVFPMELLSQSQISVGKIWRAIDDTCARIGCKPIEGDEQRHVFDEIIPRTLDRRRVVESVLTVSQSLDIFGPPTWLQWPQFASFHRGYMSDPCELNRIFQTTRINLHNSGLAMHFRVVDCMAAGGFILVNETPLDWMSGGIRQYFEPDRHYGSYRIENVADVARRYLMDDEARARIAEVGRAEVLRAHTNTHRAAQILTDFGLEPRGSDANRTALHELTRAAQASLDELAVANVPA